jgi:adenylate cyclase
MKLVAVLRESERWVALATALLATAAILLARTTGWFEPVELAVYDRLLALRPEPQDPGHRVVVVAYTEKDIQQQHTYPLPDETLARVLETVLSFGPRGVGVDFYRDVLIPPGSEQLEDVLRRDPRVVMVHLVSEGDKPAIPPPDVLIGSQQNGFADVKLDRDDTVRRALLYLDDDDGEPLLSLPLQVALRYLDDEGVGLGVDPEDDQQIRLGPTRLTRFRSNDGGYSHAEARGYQMLLDFEGRKPFRSIPMGDVLRGAVGPEDFRDKMVFVGATAESVADLRRAPFGLWPGIFLHAHVASQLVRYGLGEDRPLATLPEAGESAWIALWAVLGAALGLRRGSLWRFGAITAAGILVVGASGLASLLGGWWIPVAPPLLAWLLSAATVTAYVSRREHADRQVLMDLFARHVSKTVAEDLWEKRDQFMEGGRPIPRRQAVTVLFVDVKSFTPVAEGLDPLGLMDWVNELMEVCASEVEIHGGFVDDYFGDGMKAAFGVPLPSESEEEQNAQAVAAVRCATAMEEKLAGLNKSWRERDMPTGSLRVGIDSGLAVAGRVGSSDRLKYTVLGDVANTAARLESLDDSDHDFSLKRVRILVSHRTRARLGDAFLTHARGEVMLKGKAKPVDVFEILGPAPPREPQAPESARSEPERPDRPSRALR